MLAQLRLSLIIFSFVMFSLIQAQRGSMPVATFSIVAVDTAAGECGVAVASRFFSVGSVVPWAKADVGAVATQSYANTSFGPRGLELMEKGVTPQEAVAILLRNDSSPKKRQFGIVAANGQSATYTGELCNSWAGGRNGFGYAVQGNILAAESVVSSMEKVFLETKGTLADRMYAALLAGDEQGGDARGKQSASMHVVKARAGYGGHTDRAIDIRVDDHEEPFKKLGNLLDYAQMNYSWNEAWTLFRNNKSKQALTPMERTAKLAPENPEVLYDLAVIRLAAGDKDKALHALHKALELNANLKKQASGDNDLLELKDNTAFQKMIK